MVSLPAPSKKLLVIGASMSEPHTSVVNGKFLCMYVLSRWWYVRPPRTQGSYILFPYKSGYSYSGFLRLVPSMLQGAFAYARVYRDGNAYAGYAVEESVRGSAAPQKQEGFRRESDGAGAVSQSAYTELLVVSSILLVCFNKSEYVDMYIW